MHKSSMLRMKWFVENYVSKINKDKIKVLDVGSYDVNGSYKKIFADKKYEYIGLDMEKGTNVDIFLKNPYDWHEIPTDSFDVVISGQAFEHIEFFWVTMAEMTRVLKKDGLLCIIAPNGGLEHRYPIDCYRYFTDGMIALAKYVSLEPLHAHTNCVPVSNCSGWQHKQNDSDSVLIAKKPYSGTPKIVNLQIYKCIPANQETLRTGLIPYKGKLDHLWQMIKKSINNRLKG